MNNIESLNTVARNALFAKYLVVLGQLMVAEGLTVSQAVDSGAWDITLAAKLQAEGVDGDFAKDVVFWASNKLNVKI